MKFIEHHIRQVEIIFEAYKGQEPLHLFLKKYFKKNKKFGSRDRRNIAEYLYGVFRIGRENRHLSIRQRVYIYLFLKGEMPVGFFIEDFSALALMQNQPFEARLLFIQNKYELRNSFRTQEEISSSIDTTNYRNSFYHEPQVFIRFRKNSKQKYKEFIDEHNGLCIEDATYVFPPKTNLESFLDAKDYVVQDMNSQRTIRYVPTLQQGALVWDCCAGSGGKSILLLDKFPEVELTVTDVRPTILRSLIERFTLYDVEAEIIAEVNVNKEKDLTVLEDRYYDFIICDAPCTGSGTWARTPEQFYYFDKKEVDRFQKRQLDILLNASTRLKNNGELLYITCSVFAKENEHVVNKFLEHFKEFTLLTQEYLDGTSLKADTLFIAKFIKK